MRTGYADWMALEPRAVAEASGGKLPMIVVEPGYPAIDTGITVAVLDTGIDLAHSDALQRDLDLMDTRCFVPGDTVSG